MAEKKIDVTALGELLIDFTENGTSAQGNPILEVNPGGAPCNVLAMLQKLGKQTAFIGKVGDDMFGRQLTEAVSSVGVDTRALLVDKEVHTTLAFVHTYPDGDRDFSFYRNPGADMMLTKDDVDEDLIRSSRIFHFGTLSSTHEGVREATRYAIEVAREAGDLISFDPNLRPPLWSSLDDAKREIEYGLAIRAASDSLLQREEENKILIVLSDGRPNDVVVNRPNSRNPKAYCGDYAIKDTAQEVRKARNKGIFVLGVFAGKEQDLQAEKRIFGKDFAYIRDIRNVVGQYLQKLLDW